MNVAYHSFVSRVTNKTDWSKTQSLLTQSLYFFFFTSNSEENERRRKKIRGPFRLIDQADTTGDHSHPQSLDNNLPQ